MLEHLRSRWTKVMAPIARALLSAHVTPDMVTWAGTIGVVAVSLICFPHGWLWQGVLLLLVFIFSDSLDGIMARTSGRSSDWGAFLDSTLDRIADGAVMGSLAVWAALRMEPGTLRTVTVVLATASVVLGAVVPYARARAESVGATAAVGVAERTDRLVVSLVAAFIVGLGAPQWVLSGALGYVAAACLVTVVQRVLTVRGQIGPGAAVRQEPALGAGTSGGRA